MKLEGKTALVTGAARGIGKAIARSLAREGAAVGLIDLRGAAAAAEELTAEGFRAVPIELDITDHEAVKAAIDRTAGTIGSPDILVNNAGIIARESFTELSYETWKRVLDVNLNGTFNCCKAVVPYMISKRSGCILNVTSIAGKMGDITASVVYGTSKGAVNTFTKSLARQLAGYGIRVNAVAPHAIETDMSAEWSEEKRRTVIESIPLKRMGTADEVAEAVLFLVSDGAAFITGEILDVNGGYLMD
jgi:3-oxoacyl-[acyl-carrier protein] reductase